MIWIKEYYKTNAYVQFAGAKEMYFRQIAKLLPHKSLLGVKNKNSASQLLSQRLAR